MAPRRLKPNGKVLAMLSPGLFASGCQFVEYDPVANTLTNTANPTNCPSDSSYVGHLMILPTGQIMFTDFSGRVEIYTPAQGVVSGVAPTINPVSGQINSPSTNNVLSGSQLNGLSENNAYGDDYQGATNYPLVRLVQVDAPNNVYYATTHNETTHSIAPSTPNSTQFDVTAGLPAGNYTLYAVANGIESNGMPVTIVAGPDFSLTANPSTVSHCAGQQRHEPHHGRSCERLQRQRQLERLRSAERRVGRVLAESDHYNQHPDPHGQRHCHQGNVDCDHYRHVGHCDAYHDDTTHGYCRRWPSRYSHADVADVREESSVGTTSPGQRTSPSLNYRKRDAEHQQHCDQR